MQENEDVKRGELIDLAKFRAAGKAKSSTPIESESKGAVKPIDFSERRVAKLRGSEPSPVFSQLDAWVERHRATMNLHGPEMHRIRTRLDEEKMREWNEFQDSVTKLLGDLAECKKTGNISPIIHRDVQIFANVAQHFCNLVSTDSKQRETLLRQGNQILSLLKSIKNADEA